MKSIWWVVALATFALIFLLFPVIEVEHVDKELVVGEGTYYEKQLEWGACAYLQPGAVQQFLAKNEISEYYLERGGNLIAVYVPQYKDVPKTGEVVKVQVARTTGRMGLLEQLWLHYHASPFEPIAITGSGRKTRQPFTVNTKEWVIDWAYVPDPNHPEGNFFGFVVTAQGETPRDVESMLFAEETSGSIHSDAGPGEYYVTVEATNIRSWGILIKPA